jgi:hypothetical protein
MAITDQDKQTVRMILRKMLASAFPAELGPLTVQDVACFISSRWQWRELVFRWEAPVLTRLMTIQAPLPADLNDDSIHSLLIDAGVDSGSFSGLFLEAVSELIVLRGSR